MHNCRTTGCRRTVREGYAHCDTCTKAILRDAFYSEPVSWWRRAQLNNLPSQIVGGTPV